MSSRVEMNRVEADLAWWHSREERFSKVFSFGLNQNVPLLKEKLRFFDRVALRYRSSTDSEERMALRILHSERRKIEKQLFPNLLFRMLRRLFISPLRNIVVISKDKKLMENNNRMLLNQLQHTGFSNFSTKVNQQINLGLQQFNISDSVFIAEKERQEVELKFQRSLSGTYTLEGFRLSQYNEDSKTIKTQFFDLENGMVKHLSEASNLLSGNAVKCNGSWLQLDFNDKDPEGNYRFKVFPVEYGFDVRQPLNELRRQGLLSHNELGEVVHNLERGNKVLITPDDISNLEPFYVRANPQLRTLDAFDLKMKQVSVNKALGKVKVSHTRSQSKSTTTRTLANKNGNKLLK